MGITSTSHNFQAMATGAPRPTVATYGNCVYFSMPLEATLLSGPDRKEADCPTVMWGEFVNVLLGRSSRPPIRAQFQAAQAFSGWLLPLCRTQIIRDTGVSVADAEKLAKVLAGLGPRALTALVIDFPGDLASFSPAPVFDAFEYMCYQVQEGLEDGVEKFRVILPLSSSMPVATFERLRSTIQEWIDFCARDRASDPASYEIGRICAMPASAHAGMRPSPAFYNPGGAMLNWQAFETMLETGSLKMFID
ncbi:hypothetical protein ACI2VF_15010 [Ralstonia nicotianae]